MSSGLGIPPSRPKPESENVDIVLHKPLVQAAPALSLVDYGPEPDAQEEEEEVPDPDEKAEPGITEVVSLLEDKENSQDGMVGEGYMYCTVVGEGYMYCTVVGKGYMYCTVVGEGYTVYALTFAGLNFRGSRILAIFAFLFSRTQGLSL